MKFTTVIFALLLSISVACAETSPPSINTPQAANTVLAGPASGAAALPSFRVLDSNDMNPNFGGATITFKETTLGVATDMIRIKNQVSTGRLGLSIGLGADNSGNITLLDGLISPTSTVFLNGITGIIELGNNGGAGAPYTGLLKMYSAGGGDVQIKPNPATTLSLPFQLPIGLGSSGNCLTTDGTGVLSWSGLNATQLTGSIADARLSANVPLLNTLNTFTITSPANTPQLVLADSGGNRMEFYSRYTGVSDALYINGTGNTFILSNGSNSSRVVITGGEIQISNGQGTIGFTAGTTTRYASVLTAGWGQPAIYGSGRVTAQTTAATLATYTCGAADGSFHVSANINVTTATSHNFIVTCTYTDETNTSRTMTLPFTGLAGTYSTIIANTGGAVPYESSVMHIRVKASTAITLATANGGGTNFTTVTYNGEGCIQQIK